MTGACDCSSGDIVIRPSAGSCTRDRIRQQRAVLPLLGVAVLFGLIGPLALAVTTGSLSIPHNDGWSYSRIAETFGRTGRIELLGWNRSALFGQFMVLGPLARWMVVQQIFVCVLGLAALAATYDLVAMSIGRKRAAAAVLVIAVWPGFGLLATTFMPDVPAMAATMICLALGRRALRHGSIWLLVGSIAFGVWGVTIREQALAAPVAVLLMAGVSAWRSRQKRDWTVLICTVVAFISVVVSFELWRRSYTAEDPPVISDPPSMLGLGTSVIVRSYFVLALSLTPAVLLVARPWRWRRGALLTAVAALVISGGAVHDFGAQSFFTGNYLDSSGPYWIAGNGRPAAIFFPGLWWLVVAVACGSGALLAGVLIRRLPHIDPLLGFFLLFTVMGNFASAISGQAIFDRYWLLAAAPLLAAVLSERTRSDGPALARVRERALAAIGWAAVAALSLTITAAGMAYDTARWNSGAQLVTTGVPATQVDGGLEWNGYHSAIGMSPAGSGSFPGSSSCFTITAEQRMDQTAIRVVPYRTFVIAGTSRLWIYDNGLPHCEKSPTRWFAEK